MQNAFDQVDGRQGHFDLQKSKRCRQLLCSGGVMLIKLPLSSTFAIIEERALWLSPYMCGCMSTNFEGSTSIPKGVLLRFCRSTDAGKGNGRSAWCSFVPKACRSKVVHKYAALLNVKRDTVEVLCVC